MTVPEGQILEALTDALNQRKAAFRATATEMGVTGMPATIPIDAVVALIAQLRNVEVPSGAFRYEVQIDADTAEQADQVIGERLGHDEDYGFGYRIVSWAALPQ